MLDKSKIRIRTLDASEIEIRVQSVSAKGTSLLLYKNARADMTILDEAFGITGWQRKHEILDGNNYCTVSIKDPDSGEWVSKMDVGTESFAEPVKGESSDSFKRACTNIGIGRELYTAPFIWIPAEKVNIAVKNDRYVVRDSFHIVSIAYDDRRNITELTVANQRGEIVFQFQKKSGDSAAEQKTGKSGSRKNAGGKKTMKEGITVHQANLFRSLLEEHGITEAAVLKKHNLNTLEDMPLELYNNAVLALTQGAA